MLLINNEIPLSMYEAKKTLNPLGMEYEKIHACYETPRKSNFLKKGKMEISVKIRNFFRSQMMKRTLPLESSREI